MMDIAVGGELNISAQDLLGQCIAILGIRGSGKSNTATVLAEEMLAAGLTVCIVDIAGEFFGLTEKYQVLVAGKSANVNVPLALGQGAALAEFSMCNGVSVILDLSGYRREERFEILNEYLERAWDIAGERRSPYFVFLEEAHNYIPQSGGSVVDDIVISMATEGRKRGLSLVMVSQRPQKIDKDVLTQAEIYFLHRVRHPLDINAYKSIIYDGQVKSEDIRQLATGEAIVLHGEQLTRANVRKQHVFHGGYTPGLESVVAPALRTIDETMLQKLQAMLGTARPADRNKEQLLRQILDLTEERDRLLAKNKALSGQVELLSRLSVEAVAVPTPNTMQVEKIHTGQIVTNGASAVAQPVLPAPATTTQRPASAKPQPHVSPLAERRAINNQKRRFDGLLNELRELRLRAPIKLFTLQYLISHSDKEFSTHDLAASMGYSSSTFVRNPPLELMQKGLIARTGSGNHNYKYSAKGIRATLAKEYPALDAEKMVEQILRIE